MSDTAASSSAPAVPDARPDAVFSWLMGAFVAIVVLTNTVGTKLFVVGDVTLPTSLMWFPVTFLITDIVSEVYGAKRAQMLVWAGFLASLGLLVSVLVALALPASPIYALDAEFKAVFSPTWRLLFASMAAYLLAQSVDVRIFHFLKDRTGDRLLWLRNNVSTMSSQAVDTLTVNFIFLYANPAVFTGSVLDILQICLGTYAFKVAIAAADTPLFYVGVKAVRRLRARLNEAECAA